MVAPIPLVMAIPLSAILMGTGVVVIMDFVIIRTCIVIALAV